MQRFFYPIRDLSERLTTLQQSMASCERIFGILDEPEEVTDAPDARRPGAIEGKIEFRDVWFAYDEGNWVLRDMSFTIRARREGRHRRCHRCRQVDHDVTA